MQLHSRYCAKYEYTFTYFLSLLIVLIAYLLKVNNVFTVSISRANVTLLNLI